jgi:hypothetical protein
MLPRFHYYDLSSKFGRASLVEDIRYSGSKMVCNFEKIHCHNWARRAMALSFSVAAGMALLPLHPIQALFVLPLISFTSDVVNEKLKPAHILHDWACDVQKEYAKHHPEEVITYQIYSGRGVFVCLK